MIMHKGRSKKREEVMEWVAEGEDQARHTWKVIRNGRRFVGVGIGLDAVKRPRCSGLVHRALVRTGKARGNSCGAVSRRGRIRARSVARCPVLARGSARPRLATALRSRSLVGLSLLVCLLVAVASARFVVPAPLVRTGCLGTAPLLRALRSLVLVLLARGGSTPVVPGSSGDRTALPCPGACRDLGGGSGRLGGRGGGAGESDGHVVMACGAHAAAACGGGRGVAGVRALGTGGAGWRGGRVVAGGGPNGAPRACVVGRGADRGWSTGVSGDDRRRGRVLRILVVVP